MLEAKRQQEVRKRQEELKFKREADKDAEKRRAEDFARSEELRKRQLEQLEQLRIKAMQQQQRAVAKVELKYYSPSDSRPGDMHSFGFGNVTTGQVCPFF